MLIPWRFSRAACAALLCSLPLAAAVRAARFGFARAWGVGINDG